MSSILKTYNRKKISFNRGKGSFLYDTKGKKYLDFVQGIAVNCLGHSHNHLIKSIYKQSKKLWHVSNAFIIPEQERLAKRLTQKTFADYVAFQNSGAEATEAAIKFARRYFYSRGKPRKNRILCINNSFHGRTLATIFASNSKKAIEGFGPKVDGFDHFNFGDHKGLEKAITSRTAAIMVETIMGEGGIKIIPDWCLKGLKKLCIKKGILLILDEVQSGVGRTGKMWGYENLEIEPDGFTLAKGLGGGHAIGALLVQKKANIFTPGDHASTFGGNPFACRAAITVLEEIKRRKILKNVLERGNQLNEGFTKISAKFPKIISDIRGLGLIQGLVINDSYTDAKTITLKAFDKGLLLVPAGGNVVRFVPPLIISRNEINILLKKLDLIKYKYLISTLPLLTAIYVVKK